MDGDGSIPEGGVMSIAKLAKQFIPSKIRHRMGIEVIKWSVKSERNLKLLSYALDGCALPLKFLPDNKCSMVVGRREIVSYRDGFRTFTEIFKNKIYEREYTPKYGDTVIDVGAYVGMFAYRASRFAGDAGKVLAIEANHSNFELLTENLKGITNVAGICCAASDKDGVCNLYISSNTACHSIVQKEGAGVVVACRRLDTIVDKADFIKIDAEGAELSILRGAANLLKNNDVKLAIACYHTGEDGRPEKEPIKKYLNELGYAVKEHGECLYARREGC